MRWIINLFIGDHHFARHLIIHISYLIEFSLIVAYPHTLVEETEAQRDKKKFESS